MSDKPAKTNKARKQALVQTLVPNVLPVRPDARLIPPAPPKNLQIISKYKLPPSSSGK